MHDPHVEVEQQNRRIQHLQEHQKSPRRYPQAYDAASIVLQSVQPRIHHIQCRLEGLQPQHILHR